MSFDKNSPDILERVLAGAELRHEVTTKRGVFSVRYPSPLDEVRISSRRASFQDGKPLHCFTPDEINLFTMAATLDYIIVEYPDTFPEKFRGHVLNYPDIEILTEIYRGYLRFYSETSTSIQQSGFGAVVQGEKL